MGHTAYCVRAVIPTLNLPPADSVSTLDPQTVDTVKLEIPAGRALIVTSGGNGGLELTMQDGGVYELPIGPGLPRIVMQASGGGLASVKATGPAKVAVWADIDSPQTDCSFTPE